MAVLATLALTLVQGWNNGWKVLTGEPAPGIAASRWFNTGEVMPSLEELHGQLVVLEFFVFDSQECLDRAALLSRLHERYSELGLRVIAITTDPPEVVEKLVAEKNLVHWVGSDPAGRMIELYKTDKGPARPAGSHAAVGVPHAFVIDGRGIVLGEEIPSETRIEELLETSHRELPPLRDELAPACALYARGSFGRAWSAARELAQSQDLAVKADAEFLASRVDAYAHFLRRIADASVERKMTGREYGFLLEIDRRFTGTEAAKAAHERLKDLRKDPGVRAEIEAWHALEDALTNDAEGPGAWKASAARERYERVAREHPDAWAARFAERALRTVAAADAGAKK